MEIQNTFVDPNQTRRDACFALLLVLIPNFLLIGAGLLLRGTAQQVTEAQAGGQFGWARFLCQVGLNAFLLLPVGTWVWRRWDGGKTYGWGRRGVGRAVGLGMALGAATLGMRAHPFAPERLALAGSWWALVTYAVVAAAEETLYRGFLQKRLADWLGGGWGFLVTALLFTGVHIPSRLLGGEPLLPVLIYVTAQILPLALLLGAAMILTKHVAAPALLHLAWNWASVMRQG